MFENWEMKISEIDYQEYAQVAEWCNKNQQYTIIEDGEYYWVVPVEQPEPEPEVVENEQIIEDSGL